MTSTLAMVRTAELRGVQTADLLATAGIPRELLDMPDARLPGPAVLSVWNALRERTGDPVLQLVAPISLPFGAYRVLDYLVGASATVGAGIDCFARFFRLIADSVVLTIDDHVEEWRLTLAMAQGDPVPALYVDYIFAALVGRIRMRIRPTLAVHRVDLRPAAPRPGTAAAYDQFFRGPVRFGADADRLCFSREEWRQPLDTADEALARLLEEHARILARRMPPGGSGFPAQVQDTIAAGLPGSASAEAVAATLHMSVRTLQRRLIAAGTTFREVCDSTRRRLAEEYLRDPDVSSAEVAFLLGFSDQSTFNRAFRRWTGDSPGRWRRPDRPHPSRMS